MNPLHDDVVDLTIRLRGIATAREMAAQWPGIVNSLGRVRDRLGRLRPRYRRDPRLDGVIDWMHRESADCEVISDDQREELAGVLAQIKALVGAGAVPSR
jgi:hypothetical protein